MYLERKRDKTEKDEALERYDTSYRKKVPLEKNATPYRIHLKRKREKRQKKRGVRLLKYMMPCTVIIPW